MPRKTLTKPRKHASQERSRATVDALIEATARILVKDGFEKASTNRIAEKAGVSVGSLYQYFPSKEALVAAVMERHSRELLQIVRNALADCAALPMEQAMRRLVVAAIEAHRIDPRLHCVLAEQMPRVGRHEHVEALSNDTYLLFRTYLEDHRDEFRALDLELATFVCFTCIEALTHTAVLHHSQSLSDEAFDALIDEATCLIVRYLR
ncbi:TetR/AcrR family transcriptional regulator [Caballeronia insecticola]|uniref:Transcriptional regulator TetR family n=1 Tax=Caballeronia insecticola TaxID=758793 RepID=R4X3D3_9BURK|nr:TetR/AcrR family transcriptional regulator [Caballeronia insecticola]BAN26257.1 transcriptional regulator TetR family [Caballeronia insecticola]